MYKRQLLDHLEDTFITPVFNGSASLRDAAGQLIEDVTKSVRRKQTVAEAYIEPVSYTHLDVYKRQRQHLLLR